MNQQLLFSLSEKIVQEEYCIASYYVELPGDADPYEKAKTFAIGQTIGTWIPVPGITDVMRSRHMGKVVQILDLSPADLSTQDEDGLHAYIFQIGYPSINFDNQLPMLITTLLGNDASTSTQAKLIDLYLNPALLNKFAGPSYGIEGIRQLCGVTDRPLLLNMIKPCTGFSPEQGARIFYQTALGGVDFIKDDELLGNPSFCPLDERVKAYSEAARAAYETTGKQTLYVPNITDSAARLIDNAKRAAEAGAKILMVNFSAVGLSCLQMVRDAIDVPILAHYAGTGPFYEGPKTGISSPLAVGKLPRLAGADIVMMNTPYGGYPLKRSKYLRTAHELSLPLTGIKPALPALGGGVNPGLTAQFIQDLGTDIMLSPGGAIQGHPMGAAAGVKAMMDAISAALNKIPLKEAAKDSPELHAAYQLWGEYIPH